MTADRYAELFLAESREHLSVANHALLALERGDVPAEAIRELFRAVHTVKGMSAAMGFAAVTELAHALESLLSRLRDGEVAVGDDVVETLFVATDALEEAVAAAIAGRDGATDGAAALERLLAMEPRGPAAPAASGRRAEPVPPSAAGDPGGAALLVRVHQEPDLMLPGARALLVLKRAGSLGEVLSARPGADSLPALTEPTVLELWLRTSLPPADVERALRAAGGVARVELSVGDAAAPERTARADPTSGIVDATPAAEPGRPVAGPSAKETAPTGPDAAATGRRAVARTVRLDARRLDALLDLAGELVIARGRLADAAGGHADPALRDAVTQLSRLVAALQDEVLSSRLLPVGQVFDRFPRLVRDTARLLGKEVELVVEGKELELDRSLLDEIGDPLVHLLRNAVDHGIEAPGERERLGKSRRGRVTLSATRDRDVVLVRVADDGGGIDRARVGARARQLGLLPEGRELTGDEVLRLVSRAGFSTSERITDVSGRGVGVDVVQARLRALGGSVDIQSRAGAGTVVTLRLPLTLAIVRTLLARVADEVYALPASLVAATAELASARASSVRGEPVLVLGDEVLPALDLRTIVGLPAAPGGGRELALLDAAGRRVALVVDELLGQQEAVVKRFDPAAGMLPCFSGATILGNGMPALIVDVGRLLP